MPLPGEWLAVIADQLLAQYAIDRLTSAAYELVIEGESYRRRQRPSAGGDRPDRPSPNGRPKPGANGS